MFCPSCGETVSDVLEARAVGPTRPRGVSHSARPRTDHASPAGWAVAWPCGCVYSLDLARLLVRVDTVHDG